LSKARTPAAPPRTTGASTPAPPAGVAWACHHRATTVPARRQSDATGVLLSVRAGLRASEIAGLSWDHVLTADGSAVAEEIDLPRQVTKGARRARVIPVHEELKTALEALRTEEWEDRIDSPLAGN